ncbi:MAG: CARDB domain-containing protein [Pseudomonadota bacterium]
MGALQAVRHLGTAGDVVGLALVASQAHELNKRGQAEEADLLWASYFGELAGGAVGAAAGIAAAGFAISLTGVGAPVGAAMILTGALLGGYLGGSVGSAITKELVDDINKIINDGSIVDVDVVLDLIDPKLNDTKFERGGVVVRDEVGTVVFRQPENLVEPPADSSPRYIISVQVTDGLRLVKEPEFGTAAFDVLITRSGSNLEATTTYLSTLYGTIGDQFPAAFSRTDGTGDYLGKDGPTEDVIEWEEGQAGTQTRTIVINSDDELEGMEAFQLMLRGDTLNQRAGALALETVYIDDTHLGFPDDHGDDTDAATSLSPSGGVVAINGRFETGDDVDLFVLPTVVGTTYTAALTSLSGTLFPTFTAFDETSDNLAASTGLANYGFYGVSFVAQSDITYISARSTRDLVGDYGLLINGFPSTPVNIPGDGGGTGSGEASDQPEGDGPSADPPLGPFDIVNPRKAETSGGGIDFLPRILNVDIPNPTAGGEVSVSVELSNVGQKDAIITRDVALYLSRDGVPQDRELVAVKNADRIDAGESDDVTLRFNLPDDALGEYQLIVKADPEDRVSTENREDNNVATASIVVQSLAGAADLTIGYSAMEQNRLTFGQTVEVEYYVTNIGATASGRSDVALYLSKNTRLDDNDIELGGDFFGRQSDNSGVPAGGRDRETQSFKISADDVERVRGDTDPTRLNLLLVIDEDADIPDADRSNNVRSLRFAIADQLELAEGVVDHEVTDFWISDTVIEAEDRVFFGGNMRNRGTIDDTIFGAFSQLILRSVQDGSETIYGGAFSDEGMYGRGFDTPIKGSRTFKEDLDPGFYDAFLRAIAHETESADYLENNTSSSIRIFIGTEAQRQEMLAANVQITQLNVEQTDVNSAVISVSLRNAGIEAYSTAFELNIEAVSLDGATVFLLQQILVPGLGGIADGGSTHSFDVDDLQLDLSQLERNQEFRLKISVVGTDVSSGGLNIDAVSETVIYTDLGYAQTLKDASNTAAGDKELEEGSPDPDMLDGTGEPHLLRGGRGDDTYIVDDLADTVEELADGGFDTVVSQRHFDMGVEGENVERLELSGDAELNGYGNQLANVIMGNSARNLLSGRQGDDEIFGGQGDDRLTDAFGSNQLSGGSGRDLLSVFEGSNTLFGGDDADLIVGGTGADDIDGGAGNDVLLGDLSDLVFGADRLAGGFGDDLLSGGLGADTFVFAPNAQSDTIGRIEIDYADVASSQVVGQDFQIGLDQLELNGFGYTSASDALERFSDTAEGVRFSDQGASVLLFGVAKEELVPSDILVF